MQKFPGMNSLTSGIGFGMHNLLNPPSSSRPTAPQDLSPHRSVSGSFAAQPPPMRSRHVRKRAEPTSPGQLLNITSEARQPRRMLTPTSPEMRALSSGARLSPALSSTAILPLSIPEGRVYTAESGDYRGHIPPLPVIRSNLVGSISKVAAAKHGAAKPKLSLDSLCLSYSTGPQVGSDSPPMVGERVDLSPSNSRPYESGTFAASHMTEVGHDMQNRAPRRAVSTGLTVYQMQLNTEAGPMTVDVDIDTQNGSKLADEKRKRNAGASARFRRRRKAKEEAASQAIANLQRKLKELTEDRDFYMHERDFFKDIYRRTAGAQAQPRPPSPRVRRMQGVGQSIVSDVSPQRDYGRREGLESGSTQRRRIGDYRPSFSSTSAIAPSTYPSYTPPFVPTPSSGSMINARALAPSSSQGIRAPQFDSIPKGPKVDPKRHGHSTFLEMNNEG